MEKQLIVLRVTRYFSIGVDVDEYEYEVEEGKTPEEEFNDYYDAIVEEYYDDAGGEIYPPTCELLGTKTI